GEEEAAQAGQTGYAHCRAPRAFAIGWKDTSPAPLRKDIRSGDVVDSRSARIADLAALARSITELARRERQLAALAVPRVFEIDPIVRVDVLGRDAVALLQERQQREPRTHLRRRHRLRDVGKVANELDPERVRPHDDLIGPGVVDIFVVIAIGAIA